MPVSGWGSNGPALYFEIGVSTNTTTTASVWDVGAWDVSSWGPDVIWTDIAEYVREVDIVRGKQRSTETLRHSVGTMTAILDNRDDRFSPVNLSGPYVSAGATQIRPRVPVRVRAIFTLSNGFPVAANLFNGYVDSWQDQFPGQVDATTYIECSDQLSVLARFNGPEQPSQGGGEFFEDRIRRIAENAGFTGDFFGGEGVVPLQATTLAQNALTEATLAADTEGGALYARANGTIVSFGLDDLIDRIGGTGAVTFGNNGSDGITFSDPVFAYDADLVYNRVSLARAGGTQQTVTDIESRALYGDLAYSRSDLIAETDADVLQSAVIMLSRFGTPEYRVAAITLYPMSDTSPNTTIVELTTGKWYNSLSWELLTGCEVVATTPGGTSVQSIAYIDGIQHTIRPREWVTRLNFASAEAFSGFQASTWDNGQWDTALWRPG